MLPTKLSEVGTISIISWLVTAGRLDGAGLGVCEMRYV
ncbi:putrescine-ornithine antiporter [Salmonella enterica subsp. arizonae]|uniref:Putrescine-ornithine antiporter n=1 Tax=Salmonella enterica subsp. arizonae TaxID=59203 RepID=A0A379TGZ7_SALER|nr:putrescine-ornithine antiporter [Salmonella enterica subsp. arizonae]